MTLSTVVFTATRLIKAVLFGAKSGLTHELNVISWEKEMELINRPDRNGCVECNKEITWEEFVCTDCANELERYDIQYQRDCICCEGLFKTPHQGELMCDYCLSQDDQTDEYEDFNIFELEGASSCVKHKQFHDPYAGCDACCEKSEYHMDTCCIEATGVCNCDLPF